MKSFYSSNQAATLLMQSRFQTTVLSGLHPVRSEGTEHVRAAGCGRDVIFIINLGRHLAFRSFLADKRFLDGLRTEQRVRTFAFGGLQCLAAERQRHGTAHASRRLWWSEARPVPTCHLPTACLQAQTHPGCADPSPRLFPIGKAGREGGARRCRGFGATFRQCRTLAAKLPSIWKGGCASKRLG